MEDYSELYDNASAQYGVDPLMTRAMALQESTENPQAVSPKGAGGIMQLMPNTAKELGVTDVFDPAQNIPAGVKYYAKHQQKYTNPDLALMAYNWGPGHVDNWVKNGSKIEDVPQETRQYVEKVNDNYKKLKSSPKKKVTIMPAAYKYDALVDNLKDDSDEPAGKNYDDIVKNLTEDEPDQPQGFVDKITSALTNYQNQDRSRVEREAAGNVQGARDVMASVQNLTGHPTFNGLLPTEEENVGARNAFNEQYGADPVAGLGRFGGNMAASAPLLMGAEGAIGLGGNALTKIAPAAGPALRFMGGNVESNAVKNAAGEILQKSSAANKLARVGSNASVNAMRGAGTQALLSSESDEPLSDQLISGGEFGAAVGMGGKALASGFNKLAGKTPMASEAVREIYKNAMRDGIPPAQITSLLNDLGPNATIGDLGENLRSLQGAAAQIPGPGKSTIVNTLEARNAAQADRLKNLALGGLEVSPEDTYLSVQGKLADKQQKMAAPLYDDAYKNNPSISSAEINKIANTPAGKMALKKAVTTMQNSRELAGVSNPDLLEQAALAGVEPTGDGIASGLKLKTWDKVKQELWDLGEAAKDKFGKPTSESNAIHKLRRDLTEELDQADSTATRDKQGNITKRGKYSEAREAFADPAQAQDAVDAGYDFMKNGAEGNIAALKNMSESQRPYARVGAANWIRETLEKAPDGGDAVKRIFGSPAKRNAVKSIFPSEEAFKHFEQEINKESRFAQTHGHNLRNSATVPRSEAVKDLAERPTRIGNALTTVRNIAPSAPALAASYMTGSHWPIVADVGGRAGAKLYNKLTTPVPMTEAVSQELGTTMATPLSKESSVAKLAPSSQKPANNRLMWYLEHLGVPAAVTGRDVLSPQQP